MPPESGVVREPCRVGLSSFECVQQCRRCCSLRCHLRLRLILRLSRAHAAPQVRTDQAMLANVSATSSAMCGCSLVCAVEAHCWTTHRTNPLIRSCWRR